MAWAVVTGASGGIGAATACALAADGFDVVVHGRVESARLTAARDQVVAAGRRSHEIVADVGNALVATELAFKCWELTGGVDAWIHVAGVDLLTGDNQSLAFASKLELALRVDVGGTASACRAIGQLMFERGGGSIVTIGWDQSATGMEGDSGQIFAASKAAIAAFSRSLAKSLAPKVRVNCVAPGWIKTAWGEQTSAYWQERVKRETPLARWGEPSDVASAIAFLAGPEGSFLTGQTICVNGGVVCT